MDLTAACYTKIKVFEHPQDLTQEQADAMLQLMDTGLSFQAVAAGVAGKVMQPSEVVSSSELLFRLSTPIVLSVRWLSHALYGMHTCLHSHTHYLQKEGTPAHTHPHACSLSCVACACRL